MVGIRSGTFRDIANRMLSAHASEREVLIELISCGATKLTAQKTLSHIAGDCDSDCRRVREAQKASIYHLVDLKRAGHSPRITELRIPTDLDKPTRYTRARDLASYFGSPSASCAELGS